VFAGQHARVFAAAEADFEPDLTGRKIIEGLEADARQGDIEQTLLAGAKGVGALAAVEAIGRGFYRWSMIVGATLALTPPLSQRERGQQSRR
jgi:hypothetical protein